MESGGHQLNSLTSNCPFPGQLPQQRNHVQPAGGGCGALSCTAALHQPGKPDQRAAMKRCLRGIGAGTADQGRNGCRQAGSDEESKGHLAPGLTWQPRAPPRSDMRHLSPAQASSHSTCPAEACAARRKVGFLHCRKCPPPARCASCIPGRHCHLVSRAARVVKPPAAPRSLASAPLRWPLVSHRW